MTKLKLVIGSKNLSSSSLRAWLVLKQADLAFEEVVVPLRRPDTRERILKWSPSGLVPVLLVDDFKIWDSLAIAEFAAEVVPSLWPADPASRAHARSVSAEMHSGFRALRTLQPMDFTARFDRASPAASVVRDIARIEAIWSDCRELHAPEGPFLFGSFSIADAMYAPVVARFLTNKVELSSTAAAYVETMQGLPAWSEWAAGAAAEVPAPTRPAVPTTPHVPASAGGPGGLPVRRPGATQGPPPVRSAPLPVEPEPSMTEVLRPPAMPPVPSLMSPSAGSQQREIRPRLPGRAEIKPIGDGIHRRR
jgi:glutathione S-transferase